MAWICHSAGLQHGQAVARRRQGSEAQLGSFRSPWELTRPEMGGGENGSAIHEADHHVAELIDLIEARPGSLKSLLSKNDDLSMIFLYSSVDDYSHTAR